MKKEERFSIDPSIIQQRSQQMDNDLYYRESSKKKKKKKFFAEREKERDGSGWWSIWTPFTFIYAPVGAINKPILLWSCAFIVSYIAQHYSKEAEEKEGF